MPMPKPRPPLERTEPEHDRDVESGQSALPADPMPLHLAYQACEAIARIHYENFPVASRLLAPGRRRALAAVYAFARLADNLADSDRPSGDRLRALDHMESDFLRAMDGEPPNPILVALADAVERHGLPTEPFLDLIEAFRMDARDVTFPTWDDLLRYCGGSANSIGRLVLAAHQIDDLRTLRESNDICTALQLTNFWQDLGRDLARGRVFIPLEDLERFGVPREELASPARRQAVTWLIEHECRATEELFDRGRGIAGRVPLGLSIQLRATIAGGREILRAVSRRGQDVIHDRPAIGGLGRMRIATKALLGLIG
jgi:squalene synthase HpnC